MHKRLRELAVKAWQDYETTARGAVPHLVRPSIPILFFGDSHRFAESALRVITVGLNPSREEFPRTAPFSRFPGADAVSAGDPDRYLGSLDAYFRTAPYKRWFDHSFEPLLHGLGASYYENEASVALHTDLCSPLATDPTWSRLDQREQTALGATGGRLWHELVDVLQPDVALISVARRRLSSITFPIVEPTTVVHSVNGPARTKSYHIESVRYELPSGKTPLFVFGRASQTPFGSISDLEKQRVGTRILEFLHA